VSDQAMCFMAGANSIFSSDTRRMLTVAPSPDYDADRELFQILGLQRREPFQESRRACEDEGKQAVGTFDAAAMS
jgi:biotin synthase